MSEKTKDIIEWIYCIIIALVLALLFRYYIGTPTVVKQKSMFPTLKDSQRLVLNRTMRITKKPLERGQIITFEAPSSVYDVFNVDQNNPVAKYEKEPTGKFSKFVYYVLEITKRSYIKRVIGIAGDHIQIQDGKVFLNGEELKEDYLSENVVTESKVFTDFIVPEGYVFAMGDNRSKSQDCRAFGCVPIGKVEGVVVFRFWPFSVFGKIDK